jgi:hypothetical protein
LKLVRKAYQFIADECNDRVTSSGEPLIYHVTSVAKIVTGEMGLGYMSVIGALLKDITTITKIIEKDLIRNFDFQISDIIKGLGKISDLDTKKTSYQPDHFRKLVVNLADDIRVILIKLANLMPWIINPGFAYLLRHIICMLHWLTDWVYIISNPRWKIPHLNILNRIFIIPLLKRLEKLLQKETDLPVSLSDH